MLDTLKSKFIPFDPDNFDFFDNETYVVLVRYHGTNELGLATVSVDEQEGFRDASKYHHLYKKKYTMDQFSVIKIADLNSAFAESRSNTNKAQFNDSWKLITSPVTEIGSAVWSLVQIKRAPFFGEDENKDYWHYVIARISADEEDPLYGLYMTIYHEKKLKNFAMDVLVEDIGSPHAYQSFKLEQLIDGMESSEKIEGTQPTSVEDAKNTDDKNVNSTLLKIAVIFAVILVIIGAIIAYK
jgi:hypothetical protein